MNKYLKLFAVLFAVVLFQASPAFSAKTVIEKGKKVKFDYTLKVAGKVVDTSTGKKPLEYVDGDGRIIPGLAKALEGLKTGDKKIVTLKPEEAYGPVNPKAMMEIPKASFAKDFKFGVGTEISVTDPQKRTMKGTISKINKDSVIVDFNHPMAGKILVFDVKIVSVE